MKVTVGKITDKGLNPKRMSNEDNLLAMPEAGLYLVADGVGGRLGGEVASRTVVDVFSRVFKQKHNEDLRKLIENTIDLCNQKVYEDARTDPDLEGMATTIALVAVEGNRAVVAHVGDSRVYRFDEYGLICLTQDHSEVGEALRAGTLTPEQAAKHPRRNVISRAIGADVDVEPDFRDIEIDPNTSFILCTDGITRHITDDEILRLMKSGARPQPICERMKELCYAGGAEDNLTAVVIDFSERRYVEEQTKPKLSAKAVQVAETPPPVPKQKIELDLKSQAPSGPLRMPKMGAQPGQTVGVRDAAQAADANQMGGAAKRKPSLGTREVTFKFPTVVLPQKEEMSRAMKMSLLGIALLAGILLGIFLKDPLSRTFGDYLWTDPYKSGSPVRQPSDPAVAAAFALHLEGRSTEARNLLNDILLNNPGNAEAHFFLGRVDYDQEKYQDAVTQMNEAAKIDANLADVWEHLALVYMKMGQSRNAMDCLQRGLKPSPTATQTPAPGAGATPKIGASPTPVG